MKRWLSLSLTLIWLVLQFPLALLPPVQTAASLTASDGGFGFPELDVEDLLASAPFSDVSFDFEPPSPAWLQAVSQDEPAQFSQVTYELTDKVLDITGSDEVVENIASEGQLLARSSIQKKKPAELVKDGARLSRPVLDQAAALQGRTIEDGTVVIDRKTQTAFQVAGGSKNSGMFQTDSQLQDIGAALENTYSITSTQLSSIFKDVSIGGEDGETIELTRANITGFAPGVEESVVLPGSQVQTVGLDESDGYKYIFGEKLVDLQFKDKVLGGVTSGGKQVEVKLSGGLGVESLKVNLQYTCCRGYYFTILVRQECYLITELSATIDEEIMINLFGINAGIKDIGHVTGGLFLIIGLDGKLRLEIVVREHASVLVGAKGKTGAYIPVSVKPIFDYNIETEGDVQFTGRVNGYIKAGPLARLDLFGFSLVGAGLLLGAGVEIKADNLNLSVRFYGILHLYLDVIGMHFDLVEYYPTIWEYKKRNMAGHAATFWEAFTYPARVSGILEKEELRDDGKATELVPARDAPYRILVIPKTVAYKPDDPTSLQDKAIRRYPASGFAMTNQDGIFFQQEKMIIDSSDKVVLEFQMDGKSIFTDAVEVTLPFSNITIERADFYNNYAVGRVEPICLINHDAAADAKNRYEYFYYANELVTLRSSSYTKKQDGTLNWGMGIPRGYRYARTDEKGRFDSRQPVYDEHDQLMEDPVFYKYPGVVDEDHVFKIRPDNEYKTGGYRYDTFYPVLDITLDYDKNILSSSVEIDAEIDLHFSRFIQEVPDSYQRYTAPDGRLVDQMAYDEYIFIDNLYGSRQLAAEEFCYKALPFSTRGISKTDPRVFFTEDMLEKAWKETSPILDPSQKPKNLTYLLDDAGNPTNTALFIQRVTVEYVWQAHPNPVRITSLDQYMGQPGSDVFQVQAEGFAPFAFSLSGAQAGISIDKDSGFISIDQDMTAGIYTFTVVAAENRDEYLLTGPDGVVLDTSKIKGPYQGNDPSPPAEQPFTLQVLAPDPEPTPQPTPTPEPLQAPVLEAAAHQYQFTEEKGQPAQKIQLKAAGSPPLTWSLVKHASLPFPAGCQVDKDSGVLTLSSESGKGTYGFVIQVTNAAGQDRRDCVLQVTEPPQPPLIQDPLDPGNTGQINTSFLRGIEDVVIQLFAEGSQPISWSLEQSGRKPFPEGIYIDPETGLLTLDKYMSIGNHYFTVRATNQHGEDSREIGVNVKGLAFQTSGSKPTDYAYLSLEKEPSLEADLLEQLAASLQEHGPPNVLTLRYDNPAEAYTSDRESKNGAEYVRWYACTGFLEQYNYVVSGKINRWEGWTGEILKDAVPLSEDYQYGQSGSSQEEGLDIGAYFEAKQDEYEQAVIDPANLPPRLLPGYLPFRPGLTKEITHMLPYQDILDAINNKKGGKTKVELDDSTGTTIPGEILSALEDNPSAELDVIQEDLEVSFSGSDLSQVEETSLIDLGYAIEPEVTATIKETAGTDAFFSFGFFDQHTLPGPATFRVKTGLAPGTSVYVYQYDPKADDLSLVAAGLTVGPAGDVSYRHDTLAILAITDKQLPVARVLASVDWQQMPGKSALAYYMGAGAVLLLLAGLSGWLIGRRRKK